MRPLIVLSAVVSLAVAAPAQARDWFVRAGADNGDGSLAKPFADPWQALDKAEANDVVHVTGGKYFGKHSLGTWTLPYDGVQLIGGYAVDFKSRDPWKNLTELLWDSKSKNWPKEARLNSNSKNNVVDGVVIDMVEQNDYVDPERTGRRDKSAERAMHFTKPATVRNSVIVNPGEYGITCRGASVIENNLIVNAVGWGIEVQSGEKEAAQIKNNTIVFSWTFKEAGKGAYQGSAISLQGPAVVTNNILAHNDNQGVYQTVKPENVSLTKNLFFMNLFANLKFSVNGQDQGIDDKSMELLEEVGLKAYDGNVVQNPKLALDTKWMEKYSQRSAGVAGKLVMDDWNKLRSELGLNLTGGAYKQATGIAPPYDLLKALQLMAPKNADGYGARVAKADIRYAGGGAVAAAPQRDYQKAELAAWADNPASMNGKALEMVVAVGPVANITGLPSQYDKDQHAGTYLYDSQGNGKRVTGFYPKGSSSQRGLDAASGYYQGSGKPDRLYTVRGVAYTMNSVPKAGFLVESIESAAAGSSAASAQARPVGRDWFVKAGATGGDGSRDKPFRDPWQALEKAQSGDNIHVAEGEYNGKLKAGNWAIPTTYIALIGGYDKDFKSRNPWKNPTLLRTGADYKGHRNGYTIEGGQTDHSGAILDGFVFDKQQDNKYKSNGDLDYDNSDKNQHVWISRPGSIIRNCIFSNGAEGALRTSNGVTVENNIFMNHLRKVVDVQPGFGTDPFIFRKNTVAFSWDIRFGQGHGSGGNLLIIGTRIPAIVDGNIFEFADNDAIRLNADARDVELVNNTFAHNLWANVQKPDGWVSVDDKTFAQLSDFGWKKLSGNQVVSANLPVTKELLDVYLNRTAYVPGKVTMDDWNSLREVLGQPLMAKGAQGPSGFMPAYDYKEVLKMFPKNPKVSAGARAQELPVSFKGS